ncbi:uncharacterized protein RSE6_14287 [Rhynchosporium secalis]|uniref:C2H2-type domain-containing protein n=1 Tax=Rhynchosporium secalis TaxID=38038 RepID=A0A1E1MVK4_RHYSE|nr:uncharacterized protein RSE6_14287 [Rhynchosporium secalis]
MDFYWGAGQDMVEADEVDRWTYRDGGEEIAWRNEGQSPKRPMQQQTHNHTRKRRRTQSSVASTPETADSDYSEGENSSPVERKQRGGKIPKTLRSAPPGSCPKCGAAYSNRGSLQEHIRLDECVLCEQCNTYVKNMTALKQHQLEEHSDVTGILRNGFSENGSLADNDGIEDNDQSGVQDTNEDGFDQRSTPHRKRNLTITISDKSVKETAMKPSCQYCRKSFTPHNLGRHLKNMSCTQHRDAKPDAAKTLVEVTIYITSAECVGQASRHKTTDDMSIFTHSRAPLSAGRDLVGLSGSSSSPQPVYASLTPQDSSQQTRKATSAKQSQREASEDELTIPDSQPRRATMTQDTFFDTTEVRNAVEEDDDEEDSMVILRGGKGKKKASIEPNTKTKSATFGYSNSVFSKIWAPTSSHASLYMDRDGYERPDLQPPAGYR